MDGKLIWFGFAACVAIGIFLLSTFLAFPIQIEGASGIDKWEHAFAYFVLSFSFLLAFEKSSRLGIKTYLLIFCSCTAYGYLLELVQFHFFSYRYFEWLDALANAIGVILGFLIFMARKQIKVG